MIATYPHYPGAKVAGTSQDAADSMAEDAPKLQAQIMYLFRSHADLTTDEAAALLGKTPFGVRPRFTELKEFGWIEKTGARRTNSSGMTANVWRLCQPRKQAELF